MGYVRAPRVFKLVFTDPEFEGLEVRARSVSLDTVRRLNRLIDQDEAAATDEVLETFGAALVEWNLESEPGKPVPATAESLGVQDQDFAMAIVAAWMNAIRGQVPAPLDQRSNGGVPSLEGSMPMEVLSASP